MRRIREMLRLKHACGATDRAIARSVGVARSTVRMCLDRVAEAGLAWPLPGTLSDAALEARLFVGAGIQGRRRKSEPDWAALHGELRRPGMTLALLWEEYRTAAPEGYGYSRFCELYGGWASRLSPTMRQVHVAGEKLFVDFAGQTVDVADPVTGELRPAQIFVAALGASNYTYAEALWTQGLPDWIAAHVNVFAFLNGVPRQVVSDNLKAGITAACRYEPEINRTYQEMAAHYGTAILPARVRKPRDKAKVEVAVQVVERWILARLRHHRLFSLAALNAVIGELLVSLNERPMRRLGESRRQRFERLDRPALAALPAEPYVYAEWRIRRVGLDYHVDIDGHYYSVPHRLLKEQVEARIAARTVEVFHRGERVAVHLRAGGRGRHTTLPEHMPSSHRRHAGWTLTRLKQDAAAVGASCALLVERILVSRPHPEQGFRACLGILRLVRPYGSERLEAACARGLDIGALSYGSVVSILKHNLDRRPVSAPGFDSRPIDHPNIRGPRYYH